MPKLTRSVARELPPDVYPRCECLQCTHQWKPRFDLTEGEIKVCPNCYSQDTNGWDGEKNLIVKPRRSSMPDGKKRTTMGNEIISKVNTRTKKKDEFLTIDSELPIDESQLEVARGTHVRHTGIESIPTFDMRSQILLFAEAVDMNMDSDLSIFVEYIRRWLQTIRKVKDSTGIEIEPHGFLESFVGILAMSSRTVELEKEVKSLKIKLSRVDDIKEGLAKLNLDEVDEDLVPDVVMTDGAVYTETAPEDEVGQYNI